MQTCHLNMIFFSQFMEPFSIISDILLPPGKNTSIFLKYIQHLKKIIYFTQLNKLESTLSDRIG